MERKHTGRENTYKEETHTREDIHGRGLYGEKTAQGGDHTERGLHGENIISREHYMETTWRGDYTERNYMERGLCGEGITRRED